VVATATGTNVDLFQKSMLLIFSFAVQVAFFLFKLLFDLVPAE
jgi:hypothetical protein